MKSSRFLTEGLNLLQYVTLKSSRHISAFKKYFRSLNIKKYLSKPAEGLIQSTVGVHSNLANKSVFNFPNMDNKHLKVFKNMVLSDIEGLKTKEFRIPYISRRAFLPWTTKKR